MTQCIITLLVKRSISLQKQSLVSCFVGLPPARGEESLSGVMPTEWWDPDKWQNIEFPVWGLDCAMKAQACQSYHHDQPHEQHQLKWQNPHANFLAASSVVFPPSSDGPMCRVQRGYRCTFHRLSVSAWIIIYLKWKLATTNHCAFCWRNSSCQFDSENANEKTDQLLEGFLNEVSVQC